MGADGKLVVALVGGLAVGAVVGYRLALAACETRVVGGVQSAIASLGGGSTVQGLAGQSVRDLLDQGGGFQ